jgi:hypothetical protein
MHEGGGVETFGGLHVRAQSDAKIVGSGCESFDVSQSFVHVDGGEGVAGRVEGEGLVHQRGSLFLGDVQQSVRSRRPV